MVRIAPKLVALVLTSLCGCATVCTRHWEATVSVGHGEYGVAEAAGTVTVGGGLGEEACEHE